ncbi:MAG: MipA/OmpV family protein [Kordiimonadaceae bacterium]|nr:MipA/OmpV family protein [Kordiimonadaceae bacterium]
MKHSIFILTIAAALVLPQSALASATGTRHQEEPIFIESIELEDDRKRDNWAGRFSLGLLYAPIFPGSSEQTVRLAPDIKFNYRDLFFVENTSIGSVIYKQRLVRAGIIGRFSIGRPNGLPVVNLDNIKGIGEAFEVGVFAGTSLYKLFVTAEAYFDVSGVHGGASVELEGGYTFELNSNFKFTPVIGALWGSRNYLQTYFETPGDSESFQAKAGVYEMFGEAALEQRLSEKWLIKGTARLSYLVGSSARSPVVLSGAGSRVQLASFIALVKLF